MFRINLPSWLYELLPALYIASGLAVAVLLPGPLSSISGGLLVCSGLMAQYMRRKFRRNERLARAGRTALRRRSPGSVGAANTSAGSLSANIKKRRLGSSSALMSIACAVSLWLNAGPAAAGVVCTARPLAPSIEPTWQSCFELVPQPAHDIEPGFEGLALPSNQGAGKAHGTLEESRPHGIPFDPQAATLDHPFASGDAPAWPSRGPHKPLTVDAESIASSAQDVPEPNTLLLVACALAIGGLARSASRCFATPPDADGTSTDAAAG